MTSEVLDFDVQMVTCPYCGESVELVLEQDVIGVMVVDCEICCRPWQLSTIVDAAGCRQTRVERDD